MLLKRKLQVSNGHHLRFDQLARLVHAMNSIDENQKITMSYLADETGLPFRQVRNRVSIGRAMGIFKDRDLSLTPFGHVASNYDTFLEAKGTLEYVHYLAAGNFNNLIWYEVFNTLLPNESPTDYQGWLNYFRHSFAGQYTDKTIGKHVREEVRFVVDAYFNQNFKKLGLLDQTSDGRLYRKRYKNMDPLVLSAILYEYAEKNATKLAQVRELDERPGAPGVIFAMDEPALRQTIELIHERGWVRYEGTHNLDQIRLKEGYTALDFLRAYYEDQDPRPSG